MQRSQGTRPPRAMAAVALLCLLALVAPVGCGGPQPTPPPDPVTIRFESPSADVEGHEALVEAFNEEHPWVTVGLSRGMSGQGDVYTAPTYMLSFLREQGAILDLSPYIENDPSFEPDDLHDGALQMVSQDGRVWAIPYGIDPYVLYYNADLVQQSGAPAPAEGWTWDDLLTTAVAMRDERGGTYGFVSGNSVLDAIMLVYSHGGWILDSIENPTRPTLDDRRVIEAVDWYADLIFRYHVMPSPDELRAEPFNGTPAAGVYAGKVGMWLGFYSERGGSSNASGTWIGRWPMRWGVAPLPKEERQASLASVNACFVSAQTEYPEACWEWVSWLSKQPTRGSIPARASVLEGKDYERLVGEEQAERARAAIADAQMLSTDLGAFGSTFEALDRVMYRVLNAQATAQEALTSAQESLERR